MTPTQILSMARNKYNSVGDTFYSDAELLDLLYEGCVKLSKKFLIERTYSSSTVAGQRQYAFPENTIAIKRIEYNGRKLNKIDFREDDAITLSNSSTTETGTPQYYSEWNETFYLRPVPAEVGTITIFSHNEPQMLVITSTLEIPGLFHTDLVNFMVSEMCAKDENFKMAQFYGEKWADGVINAERWQKKRKRTDSFASVKDEDTLATTFLGAV